MDVRGIVAAVLADYPLPVRGFHGVASLPHDLRRLRLHDLIRRGRIEATFRTPRSPCRTAAAVGEPMASPRPHPSWPNWSEPAMVIDEWGVSPRDW